MVVVVPAFAHGQQPYPPDVDAVVACGVGLVSEPGQVADHVQHKRDLQDGQTGQQAGHRCLPAERKDKQHPEGDPDREGHVMRFPPVTALLQESVHRIFQEIFGLDERVYVGGVAHVVYPACVCPVQPVPGRMRVEQGIHMPVMGPVYGGPPDRGAFEGQIAAQHEEVFHQFRAGERAVR